MKRTCIHKNSNSSKIKRTRLQCRHATCSSFPTRNAKLYNLVLNSYRNRQGYLNVVDFCAEIMFFTQYLIFFQSLSSSTDSTDLAASHSAFPGTCWQRMFLANRRRIAFFSSLDHAFLGTVRCFSGRLAVPLAVGKAEMNVAKVNTA